MSNNTNDNTHLNFNNNEYLDKIKNYKNYKDITNDLNIHNNKITVHSPSIIANSILTFGYYNFNNISNVQTSINNRIKDKVEKFYY